MSSTIMGTHDSRVIMSRTSSTFVPKDFSLLKWEKKAATGKEQTFPPKKVTQLNGQLAPMKKLNILLNKHKLESQRDSKQIKINTKCW